jgi:hypothetical protein
MEAAPLPENITPRHTRTRANIRPPVRYSRDYLILKVVNCWYLFYKWEEGSLLIDFKGDAY